MKNKFSKTLTILLFSIAVVVGFACATARAEYTIQYPTREHIKVTGTMSSGDLNRLSLCVIESIKLIDLSGVIMIPDEDGVTRTPCGRFWGTIDTFYQLEVVIFPPNLQEIVGSFNNLPNLKRVDLPKDVKFISAFQGCPRLILTIPANVKCGYEFKGSTGVKVLSSKPAQASVIGSIGSYLLGWVGF